MENDTLMWKLRMDTDMRISPLTLAACCASLVLSGPAESQIPARAPSYADLADLALAAPVAAEVRLTKVIHLKPKQTTNKPTKKTNNKNKTKKKKKNKKKDDIRMY